MSSSSDETCPACEPMREKLAAFLEALERDPGAGSCRDDKNPQMGVTKVVLAVVVERMLRELGNPVTAIMVFGSMVHRLVAVVMTAAEVSPPRPARSARDIDLSQISDEDCGKA